ncbi:MAG: adenylosuccinate lyase [Chitinivibrionales bacterium]|nr:adenylosuccinate lyase [Chitinivibrionales bacterium]
MAKPKSSTSQFVNPLNERYAGPEMSYLFSPDFKFSTWRKLWIALARCERELGLPITADQIKEMEAHIFDIDYERVRELEKKTRHDVMAHIAAFGERCPTAKAIIHLGATSAFVTDNTDLIQLKEAAILLLRRMAGLIKILRDFCLQYKDLPTLGFTHFQPAQLVTVGKRASLWLLELSMDFKALEEFSQRIALLGAKGATGTQASFLSLFNGQMDKVLRLDNMVASSMGYADVLPVSGQTYTRKIDATAAALVGGVAQTLHKIANDIRLLQHLKEIEEPFEREQVGSSAMAYKRNPMRCERMTALARFIMSLVSSPAQTAAEQWFERTLDDSANKRLAVSQIFLSADAALIIACNVCDGLVVNANVIRRHIDEELPFMATENILMEAVKRGGDRQLLHERIRNHSQAAASRIKEEGKNNDLLQRIADDPAFNLSAAEIARTLNISDFIGCAPQQVENFIASHIDPLLAEAGKKYPALDKADLTV